MEDKSALFDDEDTLGPVTQLGVCGKQISGNDAAADTRADDYDVVGSEPLSFGDSEVKESPFKVDRGVDLLKDIALIGLRL